MSYGFPTDDAPVAATPSATAGITLPPARRKPVEAAVAVPDLARVKQAGQELGFVSRDTTARRKPGPKRKEAQDRLTVTGPKRVIDRLKAYSDGAGLSYCEAIEALLDAADR